MDALDSFSGEFSSYLNDKALQQRVPIGGTFELLPFCNMNCRMCYIVQPNTKDCFSKLQPVGFWEEIMDQCIEEGMLYALITGGEPLFHPQIRSILEMIRNKPVHLALNTNGTMITEETVEWLAQVYPGRLNISLYGGSDETYGRLCRNPRGFSQVRHAFELLNQHQIPYRVHTTLTPDNVMDMDKIIEVCNYYEAPLQMVYYMFPPIRKDQGMIENPGRFTPKQAAETALLLLRLKTKDREEYKRILEVHCTAFEHPEIFGLYGVREPHCRGGLSSFWVDWKGQVSGCGIHASEHIDLNKISFKEAWKEVVQRTEAIRVSEKCSFCRYRCICPICIASAYSESGRLDGEAEYLCEFSRIYAGLLQEEWENVKTHGV